MIQKKITIVNKLGLHARAAMQLVDHASRFGSEIVIHYKNATVNAKSILNVMALGAPKGAELVIEITGEDEVQAAKDIEELIAKRFGEEE